MKNKNANNNVIDISAVRFPIGSHAWHSNYHVCKIIAAEGAIRIISVESFEKVEVKLETYTVHVNQLTDLSKYLTELS